jgi:hypothetical protein
MAARMTREEVLRRIDSVLAKAEALIEKAHPSSGVATELSQEFRTAGLELVTDIYGSGSQHYRDFEFHVKHSAAYGYMKGSGIIRAMREQVENGWLERTSSLIAGNLFDDFLEMAEHLYEESYKDAAAVIAGSALEAHLRRLADKNNVPSTYMDAKGQTKPKTADQLNADLCKALVYLQNDQKHITAWQGIRNDAAHGDYHKVDVGKVQFMIGGIRLFISAHPA